MTEFDDPERAEAAELLQTVKEADETLVALYEDGITPETSPDVWGDLKGALETARVRAEVNPVVEAVLGEDVAETPQEFLEQVRGVDDVEDAVGVARME